MKEIIIDFEFTGLDNNFITDNEIIQMKGKCIDNGNTICAMFGSNVPSGAGAYLKHRIGKVEAPLFSNHLYWENIGKLLNNKNGDFDLIGYSIKRDIAMLKKYDIIHIDNDNTMENYIDIVDILSTSRYEKILAREGKAMETAYYIVTGKVPNLKDHGGIQEVQMLEELYLAVKDEPRNEFMKYVPYGPFAGMPIDDFVMENRRMADGYRFNNEDLYARSLTEAISIDEYGF
jgi:hypothetical protein